MKIIPAFSAALLMLAAACSSRPPPAEASRAEAPENAAAAQAAEAAVAAAARPISGAAGDYDELIAAAGRADRILIGESSHGTSEYYRARAEISERLVREQGVNAVAIEADWSATQRINLYVRGLGEDASAEEALSGYTNFPRWMWGNAEFRDFVERLRALNLERAPEQRVGLYGMDVYDLFDAADAAGAWLRAQDAAAAERVRRHYRCFAGYGRSTASYGEATRDPDKSCSKQAEAALAEVKRVARPADPEQAELHFGAMRAASSVVAAEEYFRIAYTGSYAWNARDRRMAQNVDEIAAHAAALSAKSGKVVAWAHNSHVGDARATEVATRGELNLGQLMRERHGARAFLLGQLGYEGKVMAAPEWDQPGRVYDMRPALPGSWSALFRETGLGDFSLLLRGNEALAAALDRPRIQRAIGVVYRPRTERQSHYFNARLPEQFDAILFFDRSRAVTPLRP